MTLAELLPLAQKRPNAFETAIGAGRQMLINPADFRKLDRSTLLPGVRSRMKVTTAMPPGQYATFVPEEGLPAVDWDGKERSS